MEGLGCASGALVQLHGIVKDGGERGRLAVCEVPVYFFSTRWPSCIAGVCFGEGVG